MAQPSNFEQTAVVTAFLQRYLQDRANGAEAPLATYQALYPGFEGAIAREYHQLHDTSDRAPESDPADDELGTATLEQLLSSGGEQADRYDTRAEIARGGMGRILEVRDRLLGRTSAMKVLHPEARRLANAQTSSRFLEEAQVTGQLEHPGIVPVHDLGVDAEGQLYFTMPLIRGRSFRETIDQVHEGADGWTLTRALDVLVRVCEAVAFAHSKGVIHRDLKPQNVMVGRFGEVYVMDWGLARVLDREGESSPVRSTRRELAGQEPDSPVATMAGDILGTPVYMSPEQARGDVDRIGPRSDVYSAGAMLYHLLAGETPYARRSEDSPSVGEQVLEGPPQSLRAHEEIPSELVAICEKAMARDPSDRYDGMRAVAEDLRAYLELRVVRAYRTGALIELRKWVARNRGLAWGGAAAVLALVVGLVFSLVERARAETQTELARSNLGLALGAVDRMLSRVGDEALADVPLMQPLRRELLRDALEFQLAFLESQGADPTVRARSAESYQRVGGIYLKLGEYANAQEAHEKAVALFEQLRREFPERVEYVGSIAQSCANLGGCFTTRGEYEKAEAVCRSVLGPLDQVIAVAPDSATLRLRKAELLNNIGNSLQARGRTDEALENTENAVSLLVGLATEHPEDTDYLVLAAKVRGNMAHFLEKLGRHDEAQEAYRGAADALRKILERAGGSRDYRLELGVVLNNLGALQLTMRAPGAAEETLREAAAILSQLAEDFPSIPAHHGWLGMTFSNLGQAHFDRGQLDRALTCFEDGVRAGRIACTAVPDHALFRACLRSQIFKVCVVLSRQGHHVEASSRAEELAALGDHDSELTVEAARIVSVCAELAQGDSSLSPDERRAASDAHAARAVELLRQAVDEGFANAEALRSANFNPLRQRPDFQQLFREVARDS